MARYLVIVESPSKAKTINKYLGKDYVVKSTAGHFRDLSKGRFINLGILLAQIKDANKNKSTFFDTMGINPTMGWEAKYAIDQDKEQVVADLKKIAQEVELIYLATDMDREGEAIAWHVTQVLDKPDEDYLRVVFSEITKNAIQTAFESPRQVNLHLVNAYLTRRFLDRIVGFNLSPLLWAKVAKKLSAGRVQSVATKLIVEREQEIRAFHVEEYWELYTHLTRSGDFSQNVSETAKKQSYRFQVARYKGKALGRTVKNRQSAEALVAALEREKFVVIKHDKTPSTSKPSAPFTTSTLQQTAASRLKFSIRKTMNVAQRLYEDGHITYMRTDSTNLAASAVRDVRFHISKVFGQNYLSETTRVYKTKVQSAQEAHEAIRPTNLTLDHAQLGNVDQRKLYELIKSRFTACQMANAKYENISTTVKAGEFELNTRGRRVLFDGFTKVLPTQSTTEDRQILADFRMDEELVKTDIETVQRFTKPAARYSEASLVKELEKRGIGRPSTYVPIISTIQERGYVSILKGKFFAERVGEIVNSRLDEQFPNLMKYEFTANLESELDNIAQGEKDWRNTLDQFYKDFSGRIEHAADRENGMRPNTPIATSIKCSECQRKMLVRTASTGVFLGCEGYSADDNRCTNTMNIQLLSRSTQSEIDEEEQAKAMKERERCSQCDLLMEEYLVNNRTKLSLCANPNCESYQVHEGDFSKLSQTPETSTLECNRCRSEMQLLDGRYGKYYKCQNPDCGNTRRVQKDGKLAPVFAKPIPMPELKCDSIDDFFVLREGRTGLFLAASKYPKNRQTRPVQVNELIPHANELDPKFKFLLEAPQEDPDGEPTTIRYSRKSKSHYVLGKSASKSWIVIFEQGEWVPKISDNVA